MKNPNHIQIVDCSPPGWYNTLLTVCVYLILEFSSLIHVIGYFDESNFNIIILLLL